MISISTKQNSMTDQLMMLDTGGAACDAFAPLG